MSNQTQNHSGNKTTRPGRPFLVKLLVWAYGFWSLLGWLRFFRTVIDRDLVLELLPNSIFVYLIITGLVWGLTALPVIWGLWRGEPWAGKLTWFVAVLFPAIYWFERQILWKDSTSQGNWLFMLILTGVWMGLVFWALRSKTSQAYFSHLHKGNE